MTSIQGAEPESSGAIARPHPERATLSRELLEKSSPDKESSWHRLEELAPHLDDHLIKTAEASIAEGIPQRLLTFRAAPGPADDPVPLYLAVTSAGTIVLGRCDRLGDDDGHPVIQHLDGFDPLWHEVVSLAVSSRHRFLGNNLDLWIVVHRSSPTRESDDVAYHGLMRLGEDGRPKLWPARDDWDAEPAGSQWFCEEVDDRLPDWLRSWNFACTTELDVFDDIPKRVLDEMHRQDWRAHQSIKAVVRTSGTVCVSTGDEIVLLKEPKAEVTGRLSMPDRAGALALTKADDGGVRGIAAFDARKLVAFSQVDNKVCEIWRQVRHELPTALAFLPDDREGDSDWPDLLALYRDGAVERLHYVGNERIMGTWKEHWRDLGLGRADDRLEEARSIRDTAPPSRRSVLLIGVVEGVLDELPNTDGATRRRWLEEIDDLFRPEEEQQVLSDAMQRLLRALELSGKKPDSFLPDLILRIYEKASISLRSQVDRTVRALWTKAGWQPTKLKELILRSQRQPLDISLESPETREQRIEHAALAFERWASAYVLSDTIRYLGHLGDQGVASIRRDDREDSGRWLAMAEQGVVEYHPLSRHGRLDLETIKSVTLKDPESKEGDPGVVRSLLRLPERAGRRMVAISSTNRLYLLEARDKAVYQVSSLDLRDHAHGWPRTMASCPAPQGGILVAVIANDGRRSTLLLSRIEDGNIRFVVEQPLDLPGVGSIDLAVDGDRGYVLAAGGQVAPVRLYWLDTSGSIHQRSWSRVLRSGATAVRFSGLENPRFLIAGELNGLLWCVDLEAAPSARNLAWTYQLRGAIRSISRVDLDGEPFFLAGSENGTLALLKATSGRRYWKEYFKEPIRNVVKLDPDGRRIAVTLSGGRVAVLSQVPPDQKKEALATAGDMLEDLRPDDEGVWRRSDLESLYAYHLIRTRGSYEEALQIARNRETRSRIVRCLARDAEKMKLSRASRIIGRLGLRELGLLLSYLDDRHSEWDPLVRKELNRRDVEVPTADAEESWGVVTTTVMLIQRLGRQNPSFETALTACPRKTFFHYVWPRIEFLRILARAALAELGDGRDDTGRLFIKLLFPLLELPPALVRMAVDIFPYDSEEQHDFEALATLLDRLMEPGAPMQEGLERLTDRLHSVGDGDDWPGLFTALLEFHYEISCYKNEGDSWRDHRRGALEALKRLAVKTYTVVDPDPPADAVVADLRTLLMRSPVPADNDTQEERLQHLARANQRLDEPRPEPEVARLGPWSPYIHNLFERTKEAVKTLLSAEYDHVLYQVRPRLVLRHAQRDEGNRVTLSFQAEGEGTRQLKDATLVFDAGIEEGLTGPGTLEEKRHLIGYPGPFPHLFELDGFVRPGQRYVCVEARLEDDAGYRSEDVWSFELPEDRKGSFASLAGRFPKCFETFVDQALESREPLLFLVLDPDDSRELLLERWERRFPRRRLDLDASLRKKGPGQLYSEVELDGKLLTKTLDNALEEAAGESRAERKSPFLIAPADETLERFLAARASDALKGWLLSVEQSVRGEAPPLRVLISARHASALRPLGTLPELAAHRILRAAAHKSELWQEVLDRIVLETETSATTVQRWLENLGRDLRLVMRWLSWGSMPGNEHRQLGSFLAQPQVVELLRADLRSLQAIDLVLVLLGADAETSLVRSEVVPGHHAARRYSSTTRSSHSKPKTLLEVGETITEAGLHRLRADRNPPSHLWVQGWGTLGTPQARNSRLLELGLRFRQKRTAAFERLERVGIGVWHEGIFRTSPPYLGWIEKLYDGAREKPEGQRDTWVYEQIMGEHRSPAEAIAPDDLNDLHPTSLKALMPGARDGDLKALRRWARLLHADADDTAEVANVLTAIFAPERVRQLVNQDRWDAPLLLLGLSVYGLGHLPGNSEEDDPRTHLLWIDGSETVELARVDQAIDEAMRRKSQAEANGAKTTRRRPRVYLIGPGTERLPNDPERKVAILRIADGCQAAWEGHLAQGLRRRARAQLRLTAFSPFQTSGALPPGSPLFVGREAELEFIRSHVRRVSILIVGGRRVGKTSLLNQVGYWARNEDDLEPIYVDLQGIRKRDEFIKALLDERHGDEPGESWRNELSQVDRRDARSALRQLTGRIRCRGRLPVFLFNEVDGLVHDDPALVEIWRGLNDESEARFLMVGYSAISKLGSPDSPFFHFTEGNSFGGRAVAPTALSEPAAERLLDLLTTSELALRWRTDEERRAAYKELLDRSYRIPWVLQRYGHLLVEQLERERREELSWDDVEAVLQAEGDVVWQYIDNIEYQTLGHGDPEPARRPGYQLVLIALARHYYFRGGRDAPIRDPHLRERRALDISFTVGEAQEAVTEAIKELLVGEEKEWVERWFKKTDLQEAMRLLTLTLTLEPDPKDADRYGFLLHIFPLELARRYRRDDPTLENLIILRTIDLMKYMKD